MASLVHFQPSRGCCQPLWFIFCTLYYGSTPFFPNCKIPLYFLDLSFLNYLVENPCPPRAEMWVSAWFMQNRGTVWGSVLGLSVDILRVDILCSQENIIYCFWSQNKINKWYSTQTHLGLMLLSSVLVSYIWMNEKHMDEISLVGYSWTQRWKGECASPNEPYFSNTVFENVFGSIL